MSRPSTTIDQEKRITRVIDYIFNYSDQDLSRETLAEVAHYSPEHLPKLFKQITGETPKQYSLRLRLETAFHYLVVHPARSIASIGLDCGFDTLSTFSRAIKTYFGHSPEQIRRLPHAQQMRLLHQSTPTAPVSVKGKADFPPEIRIIRQPTLQGYYVMAPFNAPDKITQAFQTLGAIAGGGGPASFMGILTPHLRNTYRALVHIATGQCADLPTTRIAGGIYARFTISGDLRTANKAAHYFYRQWLPASGYKIAGIAGFETFEENPAHTPYTQLRRHIHIPIEAVR